MDPKDIEKLLKSVPQQYRATLLSYLSGAYNPLTTSDTGSALWNQYANDANTPKTIQELMSLIDQGYNEFQIQAYVDQQQQDGNGFVGDSQMQASTLKALAKKLQEDKTSVKNEDVFTKMGVSSPLDVYTKETVPIPESQLKKIVSLQKANKPNIEAQSQAEQDYQKALFDYKFAQNKYQTGLDEANSAMASRWQKFLSDPADALVFGLESIHIPGTSASVGAALGDEQFRGGLPNYGEFVTKADMELRGKKVKEYEKKVTPERIKSYKDYVSAIRQRDAAKWVASQASEGENAIREGVLSAYKKVGRTPTMDELTAMVAYLK